MELFKNIKIGQKSIFKPVQNGIIITTSIIDLIQYLVHRKYQYGFNGLIHSKLENIFSSIKVKHPTFITFQQSLKLITRIKLPEIIPYFELQK